MKEETKLAIGKYRILVYLFQHLWKQGLLVLCELLLCVRFLPSMWVSALLFRFLVISRKQQLPLHMGQCCRCPEGIKACLCRVCCSFFDVNFLIPFHHHPPNCFLPSGFQALLSYNQILKNVLSSNFLPVWNCMVPHLENLSLRAHVCAVQTLCYHL